MCCNALCTQPWATAPYNKRQRMTRGLKAQDRDAWGVTVSLVLQVCTNMAHKKWSHDNQVVGGWWCENHSQNSNVRMQEKAQAMMNGNCILNGAAGSGLPPCLMWVALPATHLPSPRKPYVVLARPPQTSQAGTAGRFHAPAPLSLPSPVWMMLGFFGAGAPALMVPSSSPWATTLVPLGRGTTLVKPERTIGDW